MAGKLNQVVKATAILAGMMTQGKTKLKLLECFINVVCKSAMDKVFDESDEIEDEADDDAPIKFRRFTGPPGQISPKIWLIVTEDFLLLFGSWSCASKLGRILVTGPRTGLDPVSLGFRIRL